MQDFEHKKKGVSWLIQIHDNHQPAEYYELFCGAQNNCVYIHIQYVYINVQTKFKFVKKKKKYSQQITFNRTWHVFKLCPVLYWCIV